MIVDDPLNYLMNYCKNAVVDSLRKIFGSEFKLEVIIRQPKDLKHGDLCTPSSFAIAKRVGMKPEDVANTIKENIDMKKNPLIKEIRVIGGFVNFVLDSEKVSELVITSISNKDHTYGSMNQLKGKKIMVEHTSANPIHPLHIGSGRNSVFGDTLARIFKFLGADVVRHFYINDVGLQVAITSFGYMHTEGYKNDIKPDHWIGGLYAITNTILELKKIKERINRLRDQIIKNCTNFRKSFLKTLILIKKELEDENIQELERQIKPIYVTISIISEMTKSIHSWIYYIDQLKNAINEVQTNIFQSKLFKELRKKYDFLNDFLDVFNAFVNGGGDFEVGTSTLLNEFYEIQDLLNVAKELEVKFPDLYSKLYWKIYQISNIDQEISKILIEYERGNDEIKRIIRTISSLTIEGFKETLSKLDIHFDSFDWESDLIFQGYVDEVFKRLSKSGYLIYEDPPSKAVILDIPRACLEREDVRKVFGISEKDIEKAKKEGKLDELLPPKLVLRRSDGSTLYTTRDIAYTLWKFEALKVDEVYNVIGIEQKLPQRQVAAAMILMGYHDILEKFHPAHYEMVDLTGFSMAGRRGRYITIDELYEIALVRTYDEIRTLLEERKILLKKYEDIEEKKLKEIVEGVAVGAIRFSLLNIAPTKRLTFDIELTRALKLEANTAPFIQYSHARACSILREWGREVPKEINYSKLNTEIEKRIILKLSEFPSVVDTAARTLRPDLICQYAISLALMFSDFYSKIKVLNIKDKELEKARVKLVDSIRIVLRNALNLLGIKPLERM
ncbi:MAG: arginine--tRNA ligase [Candidatus Odinarchaeota archaeon]|nr:arginine--tRNA ligase [Candidatus Odinarchaeota archaeon]